MTTKPIPRPPKPRKIAIKGRDFVKELRVQRDLERQIKAERALKEIQVRNRQRYMELHPTGRASVARKLQSLGLGKELKKGLKSGLKAIKKRRAEKRGKKRERGRIGREIRKFIG